MASIIPFILTSWSLQLKKSPTPGKITLSALITTSGIEVISTLKDFLASFTAVSKEFFNDAEIMIKEMIIMTKLIIWSRLSVK